MKHHPGFLQAILDAPDDDTPRLVYADWLMEHGGPAEQVRAEFIRVQVELARIPGDDPRRPALEMRQEELLAAHEAEWLEEVPKWARKDAMFRRGFVDEVGCTYTTAARSLKTLFRKTPLRRLRLRGRATATTSLSVLSRLTYLEISGLTTRGVDWILDIPGLDLTGIGVTEDMFAASDIHRWLSRPQLAQVTELSINRWPPATRSDNLFASPECARLRKLRLWNWGISPESLLGFLASPNCGSLTWLDLAFNHQISNQGLAVIADSPKAANLTFLSLASCDVTDAGIRILARSSYLPNLTDLILSPYVGVSEAGLRALIDSPNLPRLSRIEMMPPVAHRFGPARRDHDHRCIWVQQERSR
jgi:uncharacterized protein (TIGR02996 family)